MKYIVLKSTKHEELTFHHAFIFAFIPFFIGVILSKVCVCVCVCVFVWSGDWEKRYEGGMAI